MRVAHVIEASATGTLSMVLLLANSQASGGMDVCVIFSRREDTPKDINTLFDERVRLIEVNMNGAWNKFLSFFVMRKLVKTLRFNVVILHSSFAGFIGRVALFLNSRKVKVFYVPHCISFMRRDVGAIKKMAFVALENFASLKSSAYIACSESEKRHIERYVPFSKCSLVENAVVDPGAPKNYRNRKNRVITVGGIREQKGPSNFADIARRVTCERSEVEFCWVGDGDPVFKSELISAGVNVLGWKTRNEVYDLLNESRFFLSTSRWEGMPVSVIEALYSKTFVVASSCPGNVDVIIDNKTGFLFDEPVDAAKMILSLIDDSDFCVSITDSAYLDARSRFSTQIYLDSFNQLIGNDCA